MNVGNVTIIIATKDNDEAMSAFYRDILGFTKNDHGGWDKANLSIFFDRHSQAALKNPEPFRHMITLNLDGQSVEEAYEELKAKGVEFIAPVHKEEWGGKFATFTDPDGNYVQIFSF